MKVIEPKVEIITPLDGDQILKTIETAGRTCYKSEGSISANSALKFVSNIIKRGHEAVLEHYSFTVRFTCDRGVSHEIVRHRLASYCQESTRYCNYSKDKFNNEITFIKPFFWSENSIEYQIWHQSCENAEKDYLQLLENGATPEQARTVLPNSLKTELIMTANLREWRYFISLRGSAVAHPQMRQIVSMLLEQIKKAIPIIFDDIKEIELNEKDE